MFKGDLRKYNYWMKIIINGIEKNYKSSFTLETLLIELGYANKKVAVEVNKEVIPRFELRNKLVVEGDKIEIINAIGGG